MNWKIVSKDGNPEKEGLYDCVLIHEEMKLKNPSMLNTDQEEWIPTGKVFAICDERLFGSAEINKDWIMEGQPNKGLAWIKQSGSYSNETVYAWLPKREFPDIELPTGVEWSNEIDS